MLFSGSPTCNAVIEGLRGVGYRGGMLAENYKFLDWFSPTSDERTVAAAAFAQTPISYDSACIGVVISNGVHGPQLIDKYRALGTPVILEIDYSEVREWAVSRKQGEHGLIDRYSPDQIGQLFSRRASEWKPEAFLRAKNIGTFRWSQQLDLFSGLVPELESQIQQKMDPLLRDALSVTKSVYQESAKKPADPGQLFKLIFWLLTAKVFHDREVGRFAKLDASSGAEDLIAAVAEQYKMSVPHLLNKDARAAAARRIWLDLDFRNLSVEVLSLIWSTTLVDEEVRKKLGIHRTSRTIVRYIAERVPFDQSGDDPRIILEPCCGSGVFLIGAMNVLRHKLFGASPAERHAYFVKHLAGIEQESFGVEISRLALTLADFPNPDGWNIINGDVFHSNGSMPQLLRRAGIVLCNPPFEDFEKSDRLTYELSSVKKPAELITRILRDLHPSGVLGLVLPRSIVDGSGYRLIRRELAERFAKIEVTLLPDRAFEADHEIALLIATEPIPHSICRITNRVIEDSAEAWRSFELAHSVSYENSAERSFEHAERTLMIPQLAEVWDYLRTHDLLEKVADLHRGIEWNQPLTEDGEETGNRGRFVRSAKADGFMLGIAPKSVFSVLQKPSMQYLSIDRKFQRGSAYLREWTKPKVIVNKARRSRGPWRMAAFADGDGVVCYQTFIAAWPRNGSNIDILVLAAILNSPLANAFVATREKRDITIETLKRMPIPFLTAAASNQIRHLVLQYERAIQSARERGSAEGILKQIDAAVLDAYKLPPELQCDLLNLFRGAERPTAHAFEDYYPPDFDMQFTLSEYLSPDFSEATAGRLLDRMGLSRG